MALFDQAKIHVEGGRGGDGSVSFRREAHVPRGGPDGGDGGRGGEVVLVCDEGSRDLASIGRSRHFRAGRGGHGRGAGKHGARGEDREIRVPPGTAVTMLDGSTAELLSHEQRLVVARGGAGGHGNRRFKSSTRQAPRFAERGLPGEAGWIELRLKLLADVGIVGLPNAGKSSLLARMTRAAPKVAGYPFTTLEPVLGTLDHEDGQVVLADIPGLIEGAAQGTGLGHEFLAHVERCRLLVHLVAIAGEGAGAAEEQAALAAPGGDGAAPGEAAYRTVRAELAAHGAGLADLPEIVVLSKSDLRPADEVAGALDAWRRAVARESEPPQGRVRTVLAISSATGDGLDELRRAILGSLPAAPAAPAAVAAGDDFEAEHREYRPAEDEGFEVKPEGEGRFRIVGRGITMLVARHDVSNPEALDYLEGRLREIGVIAELERAGFEPGDEVVIGDAEFELDPS